MKRRDKPSLRYKRSESGQGMVEYAVLLALVALAVIGAVMLSQNSVNTAFNGAKDSVGGGGVDITPANGQKLNPVGPNPTAANQPTNTPKPPTSTPLPPTDTPTPVPAPTLTARANATATASFNKTATAGANATATAGFWPSVTAGVVATMTANATSSAVHYGVDPYGWSNPNSTDGFTGNGYVDQSGNNGITNVYLSGQPGQVIYFRIDTYIGDNNSTTKVDYDAVYQASNDPATNFQLSLTKGNFNNATYQLNNVTYNKQNPYAPIYVKVVLPNDVCSGNTGPVRIQDSSKSPGSGGADGVKVFYACSGTPTPIPTATPVPPTPTEKGS